MNMKKRWFLVPVIAVMLAIGVITAGAALAQETDTRDSAISNLASRVARILNLEEAQVQDAVDQALREMRDESVRNKLNELVEQGRITQEQADEYFAWYQSRPDDFPGFAERGPGFGRHSHGHGLHGLREFRFFGDVPQTPSAESTPSGDGTAQ
jgi:hypothetical protein